MGRFRRIGLAATCLLVSLGNLGCVPGSAWRWLFLPEQQTLAVRDPADLPKARIPPVPPPPTVLDPQTESSERRLSLDDAIRIALANSKVVRVLAGVTAVSSGRTIYDPAITNTTIDQQQGRFDPRLDLSNTFDRTEQPQGVFEPFDPLGVRITGLRRDGYNLNFGLAQTFLSGGTASLGFTDNLTRTRPGEFPLNPENRHALQLDFTQPLLQGGGIGPNLAPIVLARINTERSYFQFKDAVQESVRGVIEAYWALVFARTNVWARKQQVLQGTESYERAEARQRQGFGSAATVAQARLALANFKASLIGAEADQLQREAALRNILGLPPADRTRLVPVTPPSDSRLRVDWGEIIQLAEERRPDLIELKLIIEADQQLLIQARNDALTRVDASARYRWNGLEGKTPGRETISSVGNQFTDWTLGVNFSVPLGLRAGRAGLRRQELILARDWANLDQGLHAVVHELAGSTRNLAQFYEQYEAFKEARTAARANLDQQLAEFRTGRAIFLNVLQAITSWGDAVSAEAQSLAQYNTELATLERQTGTILETHGIHFHEEHFAAIGPFTHLARPRDYPHSVPPEPNTSVYPAKGEPAENFFDLRDPLKEEGKLPPPKPEPPARSGSRPGTSPPPPVDDFAVERR